ncbi:MAG: ATP-binding protein [Acidobacteriota bacterium]|nr:ATP-binding protein [Acidobacteriota bacterium]
MWTFSATNPSPPPSLMPTETPDQHPHFKRVLGRIPPNDFVGRSVELQEIVSLAPDSARRRGLLVLSAPASGVTELLRQAYDKLFAQRGEATPIYFSWSHSVDTVLNSARQFLHAFLSQFIAHRRGEPRLVNSPLPVHELAELAIPADAGWIQKLIGNYERARGDENALVRLCLSAPQQAAAHGSRTLILFDDMHAIDELKGDVDLRIESARLSVANAGTQFVYAGLRRRLLDVLNGESSAHRLDNFGTLHVDGLNMRNARILIERLAFSLHVPLSDESRDLLAQQFSGNPLLLSLYLQAAHNKSIELETYLDCQRLYVDELLGGRLHRRLNVVLENIAPAVSLRRGLLRALHESSLTSITKTPAEAWRKKLDLDPGEFDNLMTRLHAYELASYTATFLEITACAVWRDYLRANYRLQISAEPRALVVAETLTETLKRAPQTMARQYRRESALGLRELLARFDHQRVPASLFHFEKFTSLYLGLQPEEVVATLDAESELLRLPQVIHTAAGGSFHAPMRQVSDEERCAVAHGFDTNGYTDAGEVVWVAAEIESKVEAGRAITEVWCERLKLLAQACGFRRVRFWLVAPEGFTAEAGELLTRREVLSSNRRQLEMLTVRLSPAGAADKAAETSAAPANEFEMVIPMGGDTELIAAQAVEQIARRLNFQPEAINQIKTALIEACINATEHSLSPDRKIYQRFRIEDDKLVIIVSSRGVGVPPPLSAVSNGEGSESAKGRRGWGLKLIRALMDEVEFERVDDGTRLRMAKHLRP